MNKNISNISFAKSIAELLSQRGVKYACISPGSRNTPLTYALLKHPKIHCFSHIDERSSCFFGIGIAKVVKYPVVILTTSGTATANLFPGVIESNISLTPLIILTADRPKRLINTGETQTINQINLYGEHVRDMLDVNHRLEKTKPLIKKINSTIDLAIGNNNIPAGPVHLNIRFDEPLFDDGGDEKATIVKTNLQKFVSSKLKLPPFKKPLIVCGPLDIDTKKDSIIELSKIINAPIFADSLSQMRKFDSTFVYYEHYIHKIEKPDFILRFGSKPTSKKLNNFLRNFKNKTYLIDKEGGYNDDASNVSKIDIKDILSNIKFSSHGDQKWYHTISSLEKKVSQIIFEHIDSQAKLIKEFLNTINKGSFVFIGNSTTIRTLDQFSGHHNQINILGNYITRGIDGITSTALGMAYTHNKDNFLITGDISLFYDSNAFHILENVHINLTIIVINNNGGQIFSRLPYSNKKINQFEKFWITPTKRKIKNLAAFYNLKFYKKTINQIKTNISKISRQKGVKIIEVPIKNNADIKFNKNIENTIKNILG